MFLHILDFHLQILTIFFNEWTLKLPFIFFFCSVFNKMSPTDYRTLAAAFISCHIPVNDRCLIGSNFLILVWLLSSREKESYSSPVYKTMVISALN